MENESLFGAISTSIGALIVAIGLIAAIVIGGGLTVHYMYDVLLLHTFKSLPRIGIAQAIGLSTFLTYFTSQAMTTEEFGEHFKPMLYSWGVTLIMTFVLHFFIVGA